MFFVCCLSWSVSFGQEKTLVLQSGIYYTELDYNLESDIGLLPPPSWLYTFSTFSHYYLNPSFRKTNNNHSRQFGLRRLSFNTANVSQDYFPNGIKNRDEDELFDFEITQFNLELFYGHGFQIKEANGFKLCIGIDAFYAINTMQFQLEQDTSARQIFFEFNQILKQEIGINVSPRLSFQCKDLTFELALNSRIEFLEIYSYFNNYSNALPYTAKGYSLSFYPQLNIGINLNYFKQ